MGFYINLCLVFCSDNIYKMFHIASEFMPSNELHNYIVPCPDEKRFKILGFYTVSYYLNMSSFLNLNIKPCVNVSWSRAGQSNCINVLGRELKRRKMVIETCSVDDAKLEVRRLSNYVTVYTLYITGKEY